MASSDHSEVGTSSESGDATIGATHSGGFFGGRLRKFWKDSETALNEINPKISFDLDPDYRLKLKKRY